MDVSAYENSTSQPYSLVNSQASRTMDHYNKVKRTALGLFAASAVVAAVATGVILKGRMSARTPAVVVLSVAILGVLLALRGGVRALSAIRRLEQHQATRQEQSVQQPKAEVLPPNPARTETPHAQPDQQNWYVGQERALSSGTRPPQTLAGQPQQKKNDYI